MGGKRSILTTASSVPWPPGSGDFTCRGDLRIGRHCDASSPVSLTGRAERLPATRVRASQQGDWKATTGCRVPGLGRVATLTESQARCRTACGGDMQAQGGDPE